MLTYNSFKDCRQLERYAMKLGGLVPTFRRILCLRFQGRRAGRQGQNVLQGRGGDRRCERTCRKQWFRAGCLSLYLVLRRNASSVGHTITWRRAVVFVSSSVVSRNSTVLLISSWPHPSMPFPIHYFSNHRTVRFCINTGSALKWTTSIGSTRAPVRLNPGGGDEEKWGK